MNSIFSGARVVSGQAPLPPVLHHNIEIACSLRGRVIYCHRGLRRLGLYLKASITWLGNKEGNTSSYKCIFLNAILDMRVGLIPQINQRTADPAELWRGPQFRAGKQCKGELSFAD